jgi:hypothetical protein
VSTQYCVTARMAACTSACVLAGSRWRALPSLNPNWQGLGWMAVRSLRPTYVWRCEHWRLQSCCMRKGTLQVLASYASCVGLQH